MKDIIKKIFCAIFGHSLIQETCWGYYHCGRCGDLVGDTLVGVYPTAEKTVIIGHNCEKCRKNYKNLTWKDKIFVQNPFKAVEKE